MRTKEPRGHSVKTLQLNMDLCQFSQTKYDDIYKKKKKKASRFCISELLSF